MLAVPSAMTRACIRGAGCMNSKRSPIPRTPVFAGLPGKTQVSHTVSVFRGSGGATSHVPSLLCLRGDPFPRYRGTGGGHLPPDGFEGRPFPLSPALDGCLPLASTSRCELQGLPKASSDCLIAGQIAFSSPWWYHYGCLGRERPGDLAPLVQGVGPRDRRTRLRPVRGARSLGPISSAHGRGPGGR